MGYIASGENSVKRKEEWTALETTIMYIFEFKLDGTAAEALQQIEDKDGKGLIRQTRAKSRLLVSVFKPSETATVEEWRKRCSPVEIK